MIYKKRRVIFNSIPLFLSFARAAEGPGSMENQEMPTQAT
jgi:hypothetical protein